MRNNKSTLLAAILFLLLFVWQSIFIVDQREYAIVFQFGEIKKVITEPGLQFKMPLIQNVRPFDRRIQTMDVSKSGESFVTSEKQNVIVDYFVKWKIIDPVAYYQKVAGDDKLAEVRLNQAVGAALREEFGRRTVHDVISNERNVIMDKMIKSNDENKNSANDSAKEIGVEIVDVRLKRVEYPPEVSEAVYSRMRAERTRVANQHRFSGDAEAERISADADRQSEILKAEAERDALQVKGEGDAKAAAIYAEAYNADPEFYSFYRSLEAYRESFVGKDDIIVIAPDSDFFRYLKAPQGRR
jgi:membrane protease subunit HflC